MRSIFLLLIPLAAACGGTGENIDADGCTALEGSSTDVTAGAAMDDTAPAITESTAYTVTLPAGAPGYLAFDSTDDTEYALFADRAIDLTAYTPTGTEIPPSAMATSSSVCATIGQRDIIELPVGLFYVEVGPDDGGRVELVVNRDALAPGQRVSVQRSS